MPVPCSRAGNDFGQWGMGLGVGRKETLSAQHISNVPIWTGVYGTRTLRERLQPCPFDAMVEGQVCHLRGLLQFDPAPRNAQPQRRSNLPAQDPSYGSKCGGSSMDVF